MPRSVILACIYSFFVVKQLQLNLLAPPRCYSAGTSCTVEGLWEAEECPPGTYRSTTEVDGNGCVSCPQGDLVDFVLFIRLPIKSSQVHLYKKIIFPS